MKVLVGWRRLDGAKVETQSLKVLYHAPTLCQLGTPNVPLPFKAAENLKMGMG